MDSSDSQKPQPQETGSAAMLAAFCRMAFLHRDTKDAYQMADGDRIFANAKMEMMYAYAMKHTKYRLWLWRMLSYEMCLLSPREAFEYKWNTSANLKGGQGNNIPNDNVVELQVGEIKKRLQREGSNKSFDSAQTICKTTQLVTQVVKNLQTENKAHVTGRQRPQVRKMKDLTALIQEIREARVLEVGKPSATFPDYKDPLTRIDLQEFQEWVKKQNEIASATMVRNAHLC